MALRETSLPSMQVTLLGRARIQSGGRTINSSFSAQALLVFAMIVTQPHDVHSREELAVTLWPDVSEAEARTNLRRHIYNLQRSFPDSRTPWFRCDAKSVGWAAGDRTFVDVNEFERLRKSTTPLKALELYRGDFLPYVDHEWAAMYRARLSEQLTKLLSDAVHDTWAHGETGQCLTYLERLLELDPWREDALRYLLIKRSSAGDRAGAATVYKRFRERLIAELGIVPMPETQRCFDLIMRGESLDVTQPIFVYG